MSKRGPIIIVEDDIDDQNLLSEAIKTIGLKNEIIVFDNAATAITYLLETQQQPFIILSDINLPGVNGLEFRRRILSNDYLKRKSIPFVFISTTNRIETINEAYSLVVQGFFIKKNNYEEIMADIALICSYWKACRHPNNEY